MLSSVLALATSRAAYGAPTVSVDLGAGLPLRPALGPAMSYVLDAGVRAGWRFDTGVLFVVPEIGFQYSRFSPQAPIGLTGLGRVLGGLRLGASVPVGPGLALEPAVYAHGGWATANVSRAAFDGGLALDVRIGRHLLVGVAAGYDVWRYQLEYPSMCVPLSTVVSTGFCSGALLWRGGVDLDARSRPARRSGLVRPSAPVVLLQAHQAHRDLAARFVAAGLFPAEIESALALAASLGRAGLASFLSALVDVLDDAKHVEAEVRLSIGLDLARAACLLAAPPESPRNGSGAGPPGWPPAGRGASHDEAGAKPGPCCPAAVRGTRLRRGANLLTDHQGELSVARLQEVTDAAREHGVFVEEDAKPSASHRGGPDNRPGGDAA